MACPSRRELDRLFQHAARVRPSGEQLQTPRLIIVAAGVCFYMFNAAFLAEAIGEDATCLSARIRDASGWLNGQ
ncbi:MAG: hypothetical protein ACUVXB_07900 [Bryobacteraceae bacterium]